VLRRQADQFRSAAAKEVAEKVAGILATLPAGAPHGHQHRLSAGADPGAIAAPDFAQDDAEADRQLATPVGGVQTGVLEEGQQVVLVVPQVLSEDFVGLVGFGRIDGFAKNEKEALAYMQRGLQTRNRDVLEILTSWYVNGTGVAPDGHKAVLYGEAAFVQGSSSVARYLAFVYKEGIGGVAKNEKLARYWGVQSNSNSAFTLAEGLATQYPELTDRLQKLDPWELK
jgi:hypothetical protein